MEYKVFLIYVTKFTTYYMNCNKLMRDQSTTNSKFTVLKARYSQQMFKIEKHIIALFRAKIGKQECHKIIELNFGAVLNCLYLIFIEGRFMFLRSEINVLSFLQLQSVINHFSKCQFMVLYVVN